MRTGLMPMQPRGPGYKANCRHIHCCLHLFLKVTMSERETHTFPHWLAETCTPAQSVSPLQCYIEGKRQPPYR